MNPGFLDLAIFAAYFLSVVLVGVIVSARHKSKNTADYFLASRKLPWYAVGASFVASNISTEHFIGMVGWGYLYGMAVANWEWGNVFTLSILIGIFLPFYMRGNVTTMPEFLERRFNKTCRYIYASVSIVGLVIALLGVVMFAGAKAVNTMVPAISIETGIIILAVAAGLYTISGGLLGAVWADVMQYCLLMIGGTVVTVYGLYYSGGLVDLFQAYPEKFIMFYDPTHEVIPWTGFVSGVVTIGIWYSCANQFIIQRCLGARSEWDARMGVVMAGFSKAFLPLIIVIPGIIAFALFHAQISDGDQSWPYLVKQFLPPGLTGLVMAGLASAILSTLSAIMLSSATIFTMDLYHPIARPAASERELKMTGRISATGILAIGIVIALIIARVPGVTVFGSIQSVFFYMATPISAIFILGILWRGATAAGGTAALVVGFGLIYPVRQLFKWEPLVPYDTYSHHTVPIFILSMLTAVVVSMFTVRKSAEELRGVVWTREALRLPPEERARNRGWRNFKIWWALMVAVLIGLYVLVVSLSSSAKWFEAEALAYQVEEGGSAEVQRREELSGEGFNLWTGKAQVQYTPAAPGQSVTFVVPVEEPGRYRVAAVLTRGPGYGRYRASVNGRPAEFTRHVTMVDREGKRFEVREVTEAVFDGSADAAAAENADPAMVPGTAYHVTRVSLGEHPIAGDRVEIRFTAVEVGELGVDQVVLVREGG